MLSYEVGDAVFLKPEAVEMPFAAEERKQRKAQEKERQRKLAETGHNRTEEYRMRNDGATLGSNDDVPEPFRVCVLEKIRSKRDGSARLLLRVLFRPEDVSAEHLSRRRRRRADFNEVYWTMKTAKADPAALGGKCRLLPRQLVPGGDLDAWRDGGEDRFFISRMYDPARGFSDLPSELVGHFRAKVEDDADNRTSCSSSSSLAPPAPIRPLRALDVFAGCGGLSEGLRQAGACVSEWAIESFSPAAKAFKTNHQEAEVGERNEEMSIACLTHRIFFYRSLRRTATGSWKK